MKKILVPCDFSEQAVNAFRMALEVARESRGQVHLYHVIELPVLHEPLLIPPTLSFESLVKEQESKAQKEFEKLKKKYVKDGQKVVTAIGFGAPSVMILSYIEGNNMDLVLMGTKGATGVREMLIGSNAEKVVRRSPVPVLVVKKYIKVSSIKNIVFPNTLQHDQEDLTMKVKALQSFFEAKLHILYVNTPSHFSRDVLSVEKLKSFAKRFMIKNFTINICNDLYEESGIISFAHEIKADMIAMGTHGRKGFNHILGGSLAEDIVNHVDCPIWTYTIKT